MKMLAGIYVQEDETVVVFRLWREDDNVVAFFPFEKHDIEGKYCVCYAHVGQHSSAHFNSCMDTVLSRPARRDERKDLEKELENIGYKLKVCRVVRLKPLSLTLED